MRGEDYERPVTVTLTAGEIDWLEGAALRASEDHISLGLGTDRQLRVLAGKLRAALNDMEAKIRP